MKSLLAMSLVILVTTASPAPSLTGPMLSRRSNPVITNLNPQFGVNTPRIKNQLEDAFQDACSLAKAARDAVDITNPIFQKYFPKDEDTARNVKEIFDNIIGDDKSSGLQKKFEEVPDDTPDSKLQKDEPCAQVLQKLNIVPDFKGGEGDTKVFACEADEKDDPDDPTTMAETRDSKVRDEGKTPKIIVCDPGVAHGGIDKSFKTLQSARVVVGPDAVTCKSVSADGDRTTWRMETLGSIILHEYMHWADLTVQPDGPLGADMSDGPDTEGNVIYGPVLTQGRTKDMFSETFPDIYTWFATEAFWSDKSKKTYAPADDAKHDDEDPRCNKDTCKDPGSNPVKPAV